MGKKKQVRVVDYTQDVKDRYVCVENKVLHIHIYIDGRITGYYRRPYKHFEINGDI